MAVALDGVIRFFVGVKMLVLMCLELSLLLRPWCLDVVQGW